MSSVGQCVIRLPLFADVKKLTMHAPLLSRCRLARGGVGA